MLQTALAKQLPHALPKVASGEARALRVTSSSSWATPKSICLTDYFLGGLLIDASKRVQLVSPRGQDKSQGSTSDMLRLVCPLPARHAYQATYQRALRTLLSQEPRIPRRLVDLIAVVTCW